MRSEIVQAAEEAVTSVFIYGLAIGFFGGLFVCGLIQAVMGR